MKVSSMLLNVGLIIYIWLSEKSVVKIGFSNLSPKISGCGVKDNSPMVWTRNVSLSIPNKPHNISSFVNFFKDERFIYTPP